MKPDFMDRAAKIIEEVRTRTCVDKIDTEVLKEILQEELNEYYNEDYSLGYDEGYSEGKYKGKHEGINWIKLGL